MRVPRQIIRRLSAVALALVGVVGIVLAGGWGDWYSTANAKQPSPNKVAAFMQIKLRHSQQLLEGLALEDFDKVGKSAQALSLLSQDAMWNVLQTKEYFDRSKDFRRTADAVAESARKRNLDGAALGYVELTMQCIHCHKYLRRVGGSTSPEKGGPGSQDRGGPAKR